MNKNGLHLVIETLFFFGAVLGGTAFACVFGFGSSNSILIWIACAAVALLRIIGVGWVWSILAGALIMLIYPTWNALITGWLFG